MPSSKASVYYLNNLQNKGGEVQKPESKYTIAN